MNNFDKRLEQLERAAETAPIKRTLEEVVADFSDEELEAIIKLDDPGDLSFEESNQLRDNELDKLTDDELLEIGGGVEGMADYLYAGRAELRRRSSHRDVP